MTRAYREERLKLTHRGREKEIEAAEAVHIRHPPNPPDGGRIMEYGLMHTSGPVQYLMEKGKAGTEADRPPVRYALKQIRQTTRRHHDAHSAHTQGMGVFN
jgi:hypothetical protein